MKNKTQPIKNDKFPYEEALAFFSELYYGEHHIPSEIKDFGYGWYVFTSSRTDFTTFDYNNLTRLVLMAHRDAIRAGILTHSPGRLKVCIWKRKREGTIYDSHPTIEEAIEKFNKTSSKQPV